MSGTFVPNRNLREKRGEGRDKGLPLAEHLLGVRGGAKASLCVVSLYPLNSSCLGE